MTANLIPTVYDATCEVCGQPATWRSGIDPHRYLCRAHSQGWLDAWGAARMSGAISADPRGSWKRFCEQWDAVFKGFVESARR